MNFLLHTLQRITVYSKKTDNTFHFDMDPVFHKRPSHIQLSVFKAVVVFPNYSSSNTSCHVVNN